jgi:sugar lactone lactonase YvrE
MGRVDDKVARRSRFSLTSRQAFVALAVVLAIALIALIVYLLLFLGRPESLRTTEAVAGVQPIWQVFGPGTGDRPLFSRPMGVAVGSRGRVYVTDSQNNRVCVFDSSGRFLFEFGSFGIAKPLPGAQNTYVPGSLNYPVGIDTDQEGNVYVASFRNDSVEVFDAAGKPLRRFPDPGAVVGKGSSGQDGTGIAVTDVAVFKDRVYATDQYQVFVFTLEGELVDQWGKPGVEPGDLDHPNGLAVGEDGTVYVSDSNHARVTAFTPEGKPIWTFGEPQGSVDTSQTSTVVPKIELPRGLAVASNGSVLVTDAFRFGITRLSADGELLSVYGERGVDPGQFNFLNDIEVYRSFVVIADKENGRVQMVRLLN